MLERNSNISKHAFTHDIVPLRLVKKAEVEETAAISLFYDWFLGDNVLRMIASCQKHSMLTLPEQAETGLYRSPVTANIWFSQTF